MSLAEWFDRLVTTETHDRALALMQDSTLTYGGVRARAWALGSALQRIGVRGERVVSLLPSTPELLVVQLAILHAGGIAVPLMEEATIDDMCFFIEDSKAAVVICTRERWAMLGSRLRHLPRHAIISDELMGLKPTPESTHLHQLSELEARGLLLGADPVPVAKTDPMAIMYTSGSTSRPKGVVLDAAGFIKDAEVQPDRFGFEDGDNILGVVQLFHIAGWHQALAIALGCRGGLMMQRRFSASNFWSDVDRTGAVGGLLMPAMMSILMARPATHEDATHTLRTVLSHWVDPRFEDRFGVEVVPVWGQTELGGLAASGLVGDPDRPAHCVGRPLPDTEIRIEDEDGAVLGAGVVGEITVRSPWVMLGYWDQPEATASVSRNGWISTGDLGYVDEEGRLFFSGRLKAIIKRGGENISALEVEEAIAAHPAVVACACYSVPDDLLTEEVKVSIVLNEDSIVKVADLVDFASKRLAGFKVPRFWEFTEALPLTRSLKVDYGALMSAHDTSLSWDRRAGIPEATS